MDLLLLLALLALLVILMIRRVPLYLGMSIGIAAGILLYRIPLADVPDLFGKGIFSSTTLYLLLAFYTITFLQRMMEKRGHLALAEASLSNLFGSRRINATVAPFTIGLLPSVGAVLMARPIVDAAAKSDLSVEERCFVTSFHRHISESFLPTYPSIILAIELSGVPMTQFVAAMLPLVASLFLLGFMFYVRKLPRRSSFKATDRKQSLRDLAVSLWGIVLAIMLILIFQLPVFVAVAPILLVFALVNRFKWNELRPMFLSAFETKLMLTTLAIMVFKEMLIYTGVIDSLATFFGGFALPPVVIFGLVFFFGTVLAGSQAMIAMMLPVTVATLGSNLGILVFLMGITFIASQVSPTHICLGVITESYGLPFTALVKKTIPVMAVFIAITILYSYLIFLLA